MLLCLSLDVNCEVYVNKLCFVLNSVAIAILCAAAAASAAASASAAVAAAAAGGVF